MMREFMRRVAPAGWVALLVLACGQSTRESSTDPAQVEEARVLAAEDAYVAAEIDADEAALRRLVDDRFVMNLADGTTSGKEDLIRTVLGMNMSGQTVSDRSVVIEDNVGIIFGTTELRLRSSGGAEQAASYRYTSAYVKRNGEWRMLALHMVPLSARP